MKDDSGFLFPDILPRVETAAALAVVAPPPAAAPPAPPPAPPPPAPLLVPMEIEEEVVVTKVLTTEDWDWKPSTTTGPRKLKQRKTNLATMRWCQNPQCREICQQWSGSHWKTLAGHIEKEKKNSVPPYPDCEKAEIDKTMRTNHARDLGRMKQRVNKLLQKLQDKKKNNKKNGK